MSDVNLSEVLFKPRHNYIETSLISNSGCALPMSHISFGMGSHFRSLWYRPLNLFSWAYLGSNNLDVEEALAQIIMSKNARTREQCYDTVEQYGPGNWIYEFSVIGQRRFNLGQKYENEGKMEEASHEYRMASRYFAIAAYPNLKGDVLASQAALLCRNSYRKIFNNVEKYGHYAEEQFTVCGEKVTGYLHSPDNKSLHPCIVILANYNSTSTDFYRVFSDYLRTLGVAIFVVDMPGLGTASKIVLDANNSDILVAAVEHLKSKVNYIDPSSIGAFGSRVAANAVVRACILNPQLLKMIVLLDPFIHTAFTNQELLNSAPLSTRSSLANRMNLDASNWDTIVPQIQVLSLKKQGLISFSTKLKIPCLNIMTPHIVKYNNEGKLLREMFPDYAEQSFKSIMVSEFTSKVFGELTAFVKSKLL